MYLFILYGMVLLGHEEERIMNGLYLINYSVKGIKALVLLLY